MKDNYELDSGNVNMSAEGKTVGYNMFGERALQGKDQQRIDGIMMGSGNVPQFGGGFATQKHTPGMPQQQSTPTPPMPDGGKGAVVTGSENFATTSHQPAMPTTPVSSEGGNASGYSQSPEAMFPTPQPQELAKFSDLFKKKEGGTDVGNALRKIKNTFYRDENTLRAKMMDAEEKGRIDKANRIQNRIDKFKERNTDGMSGVGRIIGKIGIGKNRGEFDSTIISKIGGLFKKK